MVEISLLLSWSSLKQESSSPNTAKDLRPLDRPRDLEVWVLYFLKVLPSPQDISEAFLRLSEDETIPNLERNGLKDPQSVRILIKDCGGNAAPRDESVWDRTRRFAIYFNNEKLGVSERSDQKREADSEECITVGEVGVCRFISPSHPQASPSVEIEIPEIFVGRLAIHLNTLSLPKSFIPMFTAKFFILLFLFSLLSNGNSAAAGDDEDFKQVNIGAIIDADSRMGKDEKIAMEIAIQDFNISSNYHVLVLHVHDSGGDLLKAASSANNFIEEQNVEAIIGMETWQEAALVAQAGNRVQIPVLSFSTSFITPSQTSARWPYLLRMANNDLHQMRCVAAIVRSYGWRKVVAIYEDNAYGGSSGSLTLLSDALQDVGSEIEYWSAVPLFSSLSNPESTIKEEVEKMRSRQSRVFIVLRASSELVFSLFAEAKQMDLMGKDSVWITMDSITSMFDTYNSSFMSTMEGVIGIKTYFSETSQSFKAFSTKFRKSFRLEYPEEEKFEPGLDALRAYDTISTIAKALVELTNNSTSKTLFQNILMCNFSGLSGRIQFEDGQISHYPVYRIVNVLRKSYIDLKFWSSKFGFSNSEDGENDGNGGTLKVLGSVVNWPGGLLERAPRGWVVPNVAKPMNVGIPGRTVFEKFVKVNEGEDPTGFCIDIFKEAVRLLNYDLPHVFHPFNGTYHDLVDRVYLKEFDAVVGDITILANRSKYVEFTQPYAESGLSLVVTVESDESQKAWLFMKPFTKTMWLVTGAIFVYTMFVVWFLEHRSNLNFRGSWKSQVGTTLWFTFSTLFFAHREPVQSNFTRMVIVVWLFVVFVVTSSYTASLTSMLTVQRLEPTVTDINYLRTSNSKVGCDGDSFVRRYLEDVLLFHPNNIINITSEYFYRDELKSGNITAAFLELPYQKVFLSKYCNGFKAIGPTYRFGGLGFVFPKGSPIAADISEAFLKLSEDGTVKTLEKKWFKGSSECSNSDSAITNKSLSLQNFWALFVITGGTSTIVFLVYLIHLFKKFRRHQGDNETPRYETVWDRTKRLAVYFNKGKLDVSARSDQTRQADIKEWITTVSEEDTSRHNTPGHPQVSSPVELEMAETFVARLGTKMPVLSIASFPSWDRRGNGHGFTLLDQQHPSST
ncbi:hypothetical protein GIB67_025508 [Kingdonia uniflora]|uniref:Ionotropic glutamate receptor C-terminal domain-containing protein n=1 Tax=Kingdonia uniflora TaxID=39325 RepID=A0A7J7PCJ1_9MAGN|nr:hypothetical protein GIB67_025508 [Kingdonia uniflora]